MKIATRRENSAVAILDLEGPLSLTAHTDSVSDTLEELLQLGVERIVLNMTKVDCLDCAGISRLLEFREQINSAGGCLKLVDLDPRFRALLDVFHLTPVLGVCDSETLAIASFFKQSRFLEFSPRKNISTAARAGSEATTPVGSRYAGLR